MWQSGQWRRLLNLIDHLPRDSFYMEAMAQDEDMAKAWLERKEQAGEDEPSERFSEWSPEVIRLARIEDKLSELVSVTVGVHTGKASRITPAPRPVSALQRLEEVGRRQRHKSLVARVLPAG